MGGYYLSAEVRPPPLTPASIVRPNRDTSLGVICQSMGRHRSILTVFKVVIAASTVVDVCVLCVYAFLGGGVCVWGGSHEHTCALFNQTHERVHLDRPCVDEAPSSLQQRLTLMKTSGHISTSQFIVCDICLVCAPPPQALNMYVCLPAAYSEANTWMLLLPPAPPPRVFHLDGERQHDSTSACLPACL